MYRLKKCIDQRFLLITHKPEKQTQQPKHTRTPKCLSNVWFDSRLVPPNGVLTGSILSCGCKRIKLGGHNFSFVWVRQLQNGENPWCNPNSLREQGVRHEFTKTRQSFGLRISCKSPVDLSLATLLLQPLGESVGSLLQFWQGKPERNLPDPMSNFTTSLFAPLVKCGTVLMMRVRI